MTLYSKDSLTGAVASMKKNGRMSHAFLLTGEKGAGKKTSALYIAKTLMCDNCVRGVPCGVCRHCRRIDEGNHPDVITPERTGKAMIYTVETIQNMYSDAYIKPNDCDAKIYILADCENIQERTQNIMLKLIEEPPDHSFFIFTAEDKNTFLPTVLSRVITFGVPLCTDEECAKALSEARYNAGTEKRPVEAGYTPEQIAEAVGAFRGNIGKCLEYLSGGPAAEDVKLCREIIDGLISGDEYQLCKALCGAGSDREKARRALALADTVIRDVCVIRLQGNDAHITGCYKSGAEKLAARLSFRKAEAIHEALSRTADICRMYVNLPLIMSALCGEII